MSTTKPTLICSDRDGTINLDENYFLGSKSHWREQLEFLPGVVDGILLLNTLPNTKFVITTNQTGVALRGEEYDLLTEERAREVNEHVMSELAALGCRIDGCFMCPYVTSAYAAEAREHGRIVAPQYVKDDARCIKPNIGMIEDAAAHLDLTLEDTNRFVIGDRASDVEFGINAKGITFFIESVKSREIQDTSKVHMLAERHPETVFIVSDFLKAAQHIAELVA